MTTAMVPEVRFRAVDGVRIRYADSRAHQSLPHPERISSVIVGSGGREFLCSWVNRSASWVLDPDLDAGLLESING